MLRRTVYLGFLKNGCIEMTDFYVDGKKAVKVELVRLSEDLVGFEVFLEGELKPMWFGYFREER